MRPLLDDQHPQRRGFLAQLPREASAREASAQNRHIVVIVRPCLGHGTIF
jgi:hypothetical protein